MNWSRQSKTTNQYTEAGMSKKNKLSMGYAIGLWALAQPRWSNDLKSIDQREDWQSRGKRKKPKIK